METTIQIYILDRSAHNKVDIIRAPKIITPPIVGVPLFISRCQSGPSALIGWPSFWLDFNQLIILGANIKTIDNEVIKAIPLLKDKYLTIFKKL